MLFSELLDELHTQIQLVVAYGYLVGTYATERIAVVGKYRGKRFRHPMAVLQNKKSGQCMMVQFGWSGGFSFEFEYFERVEKHEKTGECLGITLK